MKDRFGQPARSVRQGDFGAILELPQKPGRTSAGERSIAVCFPGLTHEFLHSCFDFFPKGAFVSEDQNKKIIGFASSIRLPEQIVLAPHRLSQITDRGFRSAHDPAGNWLYVCQLVLAVGPGHSPLLLELRPLLEALKLLVLELSLEGVVFAAPFPGLGAKSATTSYQRSSIQEPHSSVSSGHHAIGCALSRGFEHEIALPNYLGTARNFALMAWRRTGTSA